MKDDRRRVREERGRCLQCMQEKANDQHPFLRPTTTPLRLITPSTLSLSSAWSFIKDDELLEVTPKSLRLRKSILSKELRMKKMYKK